MKRRTILSVLSCCTLILAVSFRIRAQESPRTAPAPPGSLQVDERVVAGGPGDFMEVRHLTLRGSNRQIWRKLAEIARDRFNTRLAVGGGPIINRAQRRYMKKTFPAMYGRMRGVADAFGMRFEDDAVNCSVLSYLAGPPPGCSVVYYPPKMIDGTHGVLSRNYDFTTGTAGFTKPGPRQLPYTARPYVMELHADEGYASIAIVSYDLLGGVLDGMYSQGLTVALPRDEEIASKHRLQPTTGLSVGFHELGVTRYLLETCANVDEAKEALLCVKQYYVFLPCHYIVADASGRSFIWESSYVRNNSPIIDGDGDLQVTTNFMHHLHPDPSNLPAEADPIASFNRYRTVRDHIAAGQAPYSLAFVKSANACIALTGPAPPDSPRPPDRTLWHAMYFPEKREMLVDFYLGESPDPDDASKTSIRRSGYASFSLA